MNKIEKISAGIIATLTIFGTTVFGSTGKVYNTSQGLVLRGDASKSGAPLDTIAEGTQVEIIEKNGEWYKVNANGKEGYLFAEFVKVNEEEEQIVNTEESLTETADEVFDSEVISDEAGDSEKNTTKKETKLYLVPVITASVIETIPENTQIHVEDILNNWAYVSYNNVKGWVRTYNIKAETVETNTKPEDEEPTTEEEQAPTEQEQTTQTKPEEDTNVSFRKGYINSDSVNVRKEPNTSSEIVTTLILNTGVTITAQTDEWYKIVYGDYMGYIYKPLISEKPTATSRSSEPRTPQQESTIETAPQEVAQSNETSSSGNNIVEFAKKYLGYSYVYGGTTPGGGFDCSGFVYYVFNSCGYNISRSCSAQAQTGKAVSKAELQPGDIVFFNNTSNGSIGHVGIYIGGGKMIHAANPKRGVVTDTINSGYYNTYYYSARRIG